MGRSVLTSTPSGPTGWAVGALGTGLSPFVVRLEVLVVLEAVLAVWLVALLTSSVLFALVVAGQGGRRALQRRARQRAALVRRVLPAQPAQTRREQRTTA